jgi:uncharacterized repeat protein (TIGR01451 family)
MKKKISALLVGLLVLVAPLGIVTFPAKANWETECLPANTVGQECMFTDVGDKNTGDWLNDFAIYDPGDRSKFGLRYWNNTNNNISNVNFKVTLPSGLTYVPNQITAYVNGNLVAGNDALFSGSGWNYGTFPKKSYINIYFRADITSSMPVGTHDFVVTGNVATGSGFNQSNNATARVTYSLPADSGLIGHYYSNKFIQGTPNFTRTDGVLNTLDASLNWPILGNPGGGLSNDDFSVQWTGQIKSTCTGPIALKTNSDDGIRVFFNNQLIIDKWFDRAQPVTLDSATVNMTAGAWNNIRVDYFEHGGGSVAQLFWNSACQTGSIDQIVPQQYLRQTFTGSINMGLTGEYFNNTTVSGSPVLTRTDLGVNFSYDLGSPAPEVNNDNFSVKWTGRITSDYAQTYQFCTISDDGTRLWVDGVNVIDQFTPHGFTQYCGNVALTAGQHDIRLDYFDSYIDAAVQLKWSSPSQTGGVLQFIPLDHLSPTGYTGTVYGLTGNYYNNASFSGVPTLTRVDQTVNFDFGQGSPDASINNNLFSVKWIGKIKINEAGNYNFVFYSDDGIKFTLDGVVRINQLTNQSLTRTESGNIALGVGTYDVIIEYYDFAESAGVFFKYITPSNASETVVPYSVLIAN